MSKPIAALKLFREREGAKRSLGRPLTFEEAAALVQVDGTAINKTTWHGWECRQKVPAAKLMPFVCALVGCSSDVFYGMTRPSVTPNAAPAETQPLLV